MTDLFPREDGRNELPVETNPAGTRVFRVTDRTIDQRTRLIIAPSPEGAVAPNATAISMLGHETIHEVVECRELIEQGVTWQSAPVKK